MRRAFDIFVISLILLFVVGCAKDDITGSSEPITKLSVALSVTSGEESRVDVDGTTMRWSETNDHISVVHIMDNRYIMSVSEFSIEAGSVSTDGKSAIFIGDIVLDGGLDYDAHSHKYIAITGIDVTLSGLQYYDQGSDNFSYYSGLSLRDAHYNGNYFDYTMDATLDLFMVTDPFTLASSDVVGGVYSVTGVTFDNRSAVVELKIKMEESLGSKSLERLKFASTHSNFAFEMGMDSSGTVSISTSNLSSSIMVTPSSSQQSVVLDSDGYYSVYIPVVWSDGDGYDDLSVMLYTADGKYSSTTFDAKPLLGGNLYTREITFDQFVIVASDQEEALLTFYNNFGGDSWANVTGWSTSTDLDYWSGVTLDEAGYVTSLSLSGFNLDGDISNLTTTVASLVNLESLNLSDNTLYGSLPSALLSYDHLTTLDLSNNNITGSVTDEYAYAIAFDGKDITLAGNRLSGELPAALVSSSGCWYSFVWQSLKQQSGYAIDISEAPNVYIVNNTFAQSDGTTFADLDYYTGKELILIYNITTYGRLSESESSKVDAFNAVVSQLFTSYSGAGFGAITIYNSDSAGEVADLTLSGVVLPSDSGVSTIKNSFQYMSTPSPYNFAVVDSSGKVLFAEEVYPTYEGIDKYPEQLQTFVVNYLSK